jgi:hypothetical protein
LLCWRFDYWALLVCRYTLGGESRLEGLIRGWLVGGWSMGGYVQPICIFFYNPQHPIIFFDFLDYGFDFLDNGLDKVDNSLDKVDKVLDYDDFLLGGFAFFLFAVSNPMHTTTFFRFFGLWAVF